MGLGFRDLRTDAELLEQARPPKGLKFVKKLPTTQKLRSFLSAASRATSVATTIASAVAPGSVAAAYAIRGATKLAMAFGAKKLFGLFRGRKKGLPGSISSVAGSASLGVTVIEENTPSKLRRPFVDGPAINPAQAAEVLSQTAARDVMNSLVSGVPLASGTPPVVRVWKNLASLQKSPRYFDPLKAATSTITAADPSANANGAIVTSNTVVAQRGLLQDEIVYRLTLLAENVFRPTADYATSAGLGGVRILEGFRSENSGVSPHERGEAMDITLGGGSLSDGSRLYALAQWMRDNVLYDQLILCFSNVGSGQAWIHVSFSPDARRRQVFTKMFNDEFVPGLHLVGAYTDASIRGQHEAEAKERNTLTSKLLKDLQTRDEKMGVGLTLTQDGVFGAGGGDSFERCTVDPFGKPYVADNSAQGAVQAAVAELLADPTYLEMAQAGDRRDMVPFAREVVRRVRAAGFSNVGMNAVRGNAGDPSGDAIAILNPTGAKGLGSWDASARVQIMDIVGGAHGPDPRPAWSDVTSVCESDPGGGFLDP